MTDSAAAAMSGVGNPFGSSSAGPGFTPQGVANQWKEYVAALGPAATMTDQFREKWAALYADFAAGKTSLDEYNRALAGLQLQTSAQAAQAYVSALGPLASIQDTVNAKMLGVQQTVEHGVPLTQQQIQQIQTLTLANAEWSRANETSSAGVFSLSLALSAAGNQLQTWIDQKLIDPNNPTQYAAAISILQARIVALQSSAANATPAMKSYNDALFEQQTMFLSSAQLAAANAAKQINSVNWQSQLNQAGPQMAQFNSYLAQGRDLAADFANNFGQAMLQGKTATQALNSALNSLSSSLIQMISKQLVNQALGGLIGMFGLPGLSGSSPLSLVPNNIIQPSGPTGMINAPNVIAPNAPLSGGYVHPAYYENAQARMAAAASAGGGSQVVNNINIQNASGQPVTQTSQPNSTGGTDYSIMIGAAGVQHMAKGGFDKTMKARYGIVPSTQQR
jgi:hypothetical protein